MQSNVSNVTVPQLTAAALGLQEKTPRGLSGLDITLIIVGGALFVLLLLAAAVWIRHQHKKLRTQALQLHVGAPPASSTSFRGTH